MRASEAEREAVVERLREHCAAGRLTVDELSERIERAYAARTVADLDALTADLPRPVSARRADTLDRAIADAIRKGWRLESRADGHAVMVRGKRPNHLLHGFLTVFTGIWGIVWLAVALSGVQHRLLIELDDEGRPRFERLR